MLVLKLSRGTEIHFIHADGSIVKLALNKKEGTGRGVSLVMELPKSVKVIRTNYLTMGKKHVQPDEGDSGADQGGKEA